MENNLYLKEVTLSGYKSINYVNIEFQKGLNIIIGKNAAGKTNFLKFLSKALKLKYDELNNFSSDLIFQNGKEVSFKSFRSIQIDELLKKTTLSSKVESILYINNKIIKDKKGSEETDIYDKFRQHKIIFDNTFLCHGLPKDYLIIDKPFSFIVDKKNKLSNDLYKIFSESSFPYFIRCITLDLVLEALQLNDNDFELESIKKVFTNVLKKIEGINFVLNKYSPIENIRFSENFNIFLNEDKESFTLNNLFLEYKIDGNWLPFSNLSDGTKRLFYIISEVFENDKNKNIRSTSINRYSSQSEISRIILIEEPELGIHPHQFHKLMEFLKEESRNKQIIITTHSPQALDSIDNNEFNRIIIAYSTNPKEGTKLRHLNDEELIKANAYIQDEFLSDYWLYSDLEK